MEKLTLTLGILGFLCIPTQSFAKSVDAPGHVFYKMPSGKIVKRDATLVVPARGQGDVFLKGSDKAIKALKFFSKRKNGRTLFYVVFDQYPGQRQGEAAVYRGTYSRGTNIALYYGDVFIVPDHQLDADDLHYFLHDINESAQGDARYVAGFYFKASTRL